MQKYLTVLTIPLLLALLLSACGPKEPTTVRLMTHDSFSVSEEVLQAFEDEHGIQVELLPAGDAGAALNHNGGVRVVHLCGDLLQHLSAGLPVSGPDEFQQALGDRVDLEETDFVFAVTVDNQTGCLFAWCIRNITGCNLVHRVGIGEMPRERRE